MIDLQRYLSTRYEQGARGPDAFDCWGLVRDVLLRYFDVPESAAPEFGGVPDNKRLMTKCRQSVIRLYPESPIQAGAIACVSRRGFLFHVGVVVLDGAALKVLDTHKARGPGLYTPRTFAHLRKTDVTYHSYAG